MLFVHGTPIWSFEWRHLLRALADAGHWPHEEAPAPVAEEIQQFLNVTLNRSSEA